MGKHSPKAAGARRPSVLGNSDSTSAEDPEQRVKSRLASTPKAKGKSNRPRALLLKQIERNVLQHQMMSVFLSREQECSGAHGAFYVVASYVPNIHAERTDNPILAITQFQKIMLGNCLGGNM